MALGTIATAAPLMAATGPATAFVEATAASIAAGMLLGGFVASLFGLVLGSESVDRDQAVVAGSSWAGAIMAFGLVIEAIVR